MIIVEPSVELLGTTVFVGQSPIADMDPCSDGARLIERAGRVCWKSEGKSSYGSAATFCDRVLKQYGHESIAEHASATVVFVTDRIVSHQIVRHRIAAYSQESTHYLNYGNSRHDSQIRVCKPETLEKDSLAYDVWRKGQLHCEATYMALIEMGVPHYEAAYALPMGLKTELVATYNFRTWLHVINLRTELKENGKPKDKPEVYSLMLKAGGVLAQVCPELFGKWAGK